MLAVFLLALKQFPVIRGMNSKYILTLLNLLMKSGCAAGILLITVSIHPCVDMFCWLGGVSYYLYLVHGYFMFLMAENVLKYYLINSFAMVSLSFASALILRLSASEAKKHLYLLDREGKK